ncbi:hypothetical protein BFW01_g3405 [Lasiodiplodia theobromae]|uniref:Gpi-anchored cell wall organization protein ecm33 n=1 Tax=Lasiodiplodia theobromae TaxID=45133 RepID=UPI0015C34480|nr:Gpi-anchored cell wall organization protein ecm33 [Lasiodiplodia theobromae]KAF4540047.1 Gpi-anchored cell wall organization protein ecm33 [Lasiodiplodia theobromae]KAF9632542.1 hypothetical protein BFW01_g3405 [Lasiodiplodia theobromae]
MALKYWLRVAATSALYFSIALAADEGCDVDITINDEKDWEAKGSCTVYGGDITVGPDMIASFDLGDKLTTIENTFSVINATQMIALSASRLERVQTFEASGLTILSELNFPKLTSVDNLKLLGLPALSTLSLTYTIENFVDLEIQRTFLSSTDGISPSGEVNSILLANNRYLYDVTMPVKRVSGALTVRDNGDKLALRLKNLEHADQIILHNLSAVNLPSLGSVSGFLTVSDNNIKDLLLPNFTSSDGFVSIRENGDLRSLDLSALESVNSDLIIAENPKLPNITLPNLKTVNGALYLDGNFSFIDLPAIESIEEGLWVISPDTPCDTFAEIAWMQPANGVVKGGVTLECDDSASEKSNSSTSSGTTVGSTSTFNLDPTPSSLADSTSPATASASATASATGSATVASASASGSAAPTTVSGSAGSRLLVGSGAILGGLMALALAL